MALPVSRNRTYIDQVTIVEADDMNDIQDGIVDGYDVVRAGDDFFFDDDFTSATLDEGKWTAVSVAGVTTEAATGASGTLLMLEGGSTNDEIETNALYLGTADFRIATRVLVTSFGGAGYGHVVRQDAFRGRAL